MTGRQPARGRTAWETLLTLVLAFMAAVVAVGWWRTWYTLSNEATDEPEKVRLVIAIDKGRVARDRQAFTETIRGWIGQLPETSEENRNELTGVVVSMQLSERQITLRTASGENVDLQLAESAADALIRDNVRRGDRVEVQLDPDSESKQVTHVVALERGPARR